MTTTAELKQLVTQYPADAQRLVLMSSAILAVEDGHDDLAREMVALANREGGRIVVGVDVSGRFESELAIDPADAAALVEEIASRRVAPQLVPKVEQLAGEEGPLIVIQIPRRRAGPHAVARVAGQGRVGARSFFIRDRDRTRGVSDAQLAWMYRVVSDPAVHIEVRLPIRTAAGLTPTPGAPQPRAIEYFGALAGKVPEDLAERIAADEATRTNAFVELAPWAFLAEVDAVLAGDAGLAAADVSLDDLPVPGHGSVFAAASGGLRGVLGGVTGGGLLAMLRRRKSPTLRLPAGAEVLVDHLSHQRKTRVVITHPEMVLTFSARAEASPDGQTELAIEVECSQPFPTRPEGPDPAAEAFVGEICRRLRNRWDGPRLIDSLAPSYLAALDQA